VTAETQNLSVSKEQTVAVVIAGEVGVEDTVAAITKELLKNNVQQSTVAVTQCEDVMVLPYVVKRVAKMSNFKVVLAVGVLTSQAHLQGFLLDNLMGLGVDSAVPIIPAVVKQDSLLEIKALVPKLAEGWARSVSLLLGSATTFQAPPAVTLPPQAPASVENVNDFDTLMLHLRESLKVRRSYASDLFCLALIVIFLS
jgi:6,7-dimethyl-8-ribityllumazine synthase